MELIKQKVIVDFEAIQFNNENKDQVLSWCKSLQYNIYHSFDNGNPVIMIPDVKEVSKFELKIEFGDYLVYFPGDFPHYRFLKCSEEFFLKYLLNQK